LNQIGAISLRLNAHPKKCVTLLGCALKSPRQEPRGQASDRRLPYWLLLESDEDELSEDDELLSDEELSEALLELLSDQ